MLDLDRDLERSRPFLHCLIRRSPKHHQSLRLKRLGDHTKSQRILSKSSTISSPVRSFSPTIQGDLISSNLDMARGQSILESPLENAFFSTFFDQLSPRRNLMPIRRAKMPNAHGLASSPVSRSQSTSRHRSPSPTCHVIPIEIIKETSSPPKVEEVERVSSDVEDSDSVIEIIDDAPCLLSGENEILGRMPLAQIKSPQKTGVGPAESCLEVAKPSHKKLQPTETLNQSSSNGLTKGKDTLIGGANKCHLQPDGAVLVLDDIGLDPSKHGPHHKDLAQCQGNSSFDEDVLEVTGAPAYPVYTALKEMLAKECRQIDFIRGDGNCFFRAISKQLYDSERYHKVIRNLIVDLIATNKENFAQFVDGEDVQDHVERMCQEQSWATTCEIYAASSLLQRDIYMLTPDHLNETYSWLLFKPIFQCDTSESGIKAHPCYLTMCNTNGNHYDRIVPQHGGCNCFLPHPELDGVSYSVDLTEES